MQWKTHPISVPEKGFLTIGEVAQCVGIPAKTLRRWVAGGLHGFPVPEVIEGRQRWSNTAVGLWLAFRVYLPAQPEPASEPRRADQPEGEGDDGPSLAARRGAREPKRV